MKEGGEATRSQPRTYLKIQINSEEITKNKQLNKSKRKASKPCTHRRTSSNTTCPHLHNRKQEVGNRLTLRLPVGGKDPPKKDPKRTKNQRHTQSQHKPQPKISKIIKISKVRRSRRLPLNLTGILPQKFTPKTQGVRTEQFKKKRLTGRVSQTIRRQRNNPQMKGEGEVSETMLDEKEASQLSDNEFKELVKKKLHEITENYQKLQGNYNELTANYINMNKEIETINKGQEEMKNTMSELKNTVEGNQKQAR